MINIVPILGFGDGGTTIGSSVLTTMIVPTWENGLTNGSVLHNHMHVENYPNGMKGDRIYPSGINGVGHFPPSNA